MKNFLIALSVLASSSAFSAEVCELVYFQSGGAAARCTDENVQNNVNRGGSQEKVTVVQKLVNLGYEPAANGFFIKR